MMHCPIPGLRYVSAIKASSQGVSRLVLLCCLALYCCGGLLLLLLQLQLQKSDCTIHPRPVLVGLPPAPYTVDGFGSHTSLSQNGTIAAIGANAYVTNSFEGYVMVFRFENSTTWTQLGRIIVGASFNALSDDGSVLAVGSSNSLNVRVFRLVDDDWEPLGNNITNPSGVNMGDALAISGDGTILAASSVSANNYAGEVRVFEWVGGMWSQKGRTLQGQGELEDFGMSLSLSQDGSVLAVGIPGTSNYGTNGFVRVFEFIDNDWVQIGQTLQGTTVVDWFGYSVSLSTDGQTLAVGAPLYDQISGKWGSVHIYRFGSDRQWWFEPSPMLIGKSAIERVGRSVALSGDASSVIAIGLWTDGPGADDGLGFVRFFEANGNGWIEVGEEATDSRQWNDASFSRDGSTAMAGAYVYDVFCPRGITITPIMSS